MNNSFFITKCLSMSQWYRGYEWMLSKFLPCLFTNQQIVPRGFYVQHFIRSLCWDDEKCLHTHADVPNLRNAWLIYHSIWGVTSIRCCILRIVVKRIAQHKDLTMNFISLIRYVVIKIDWFQYFLNSNMSCMVYWYFANRNIRFIQLCQIDINHKPLWNKMGSRASRITAEIQAINYCH